MSSSQMYRAAHGQSPDPQQMYNGFSMRTQKPQGSSSNLNGGPSGNRPTSAGATRSSRNNSYTYGQGTMPQQPPQQPRSSGGGGGVPVNMYPGQNPAAVSAGLTGQGYATQQRPSSAGHARPSGSSSGQSHINIANVPLSQLLGAHQYGTAQGTSAGVTGAAVNYPISTAQVLQQQQLLQQQQQAASSGSSGRPKSAGTSRRPDSSSQQPVINSAINMANIYGTGNSANMTAQQIYMQQQPTQPQPPQQQYKPQAPSEQGTFMYNGVNIGQTTNVRPLSANATSHTSTHNSGGNYTEHWSNSYKLHYGYNTPVAGVTNAPSKQSSSSGVTTPATSGASGSGNVVSTDNASVGSGVSRPNSAAVVGKLRTAVDLSYKYDGQQPTGGAVASHGVPMAQLAGLDNEDDGMGLDALALETEQNTAGNHGGHGHHHHHHGGRESSSNKILLRDDDDEMDGKPIYDSRSHPEVSMTTPGASIELGNSSSLGLGHVAVDVRNTSLDSFSEDHIQIGLTTVPNQFCTKRDALELKKLLVLSAGTRGGIVPSSSAVMDMYMVGKVVGVGSYGKVRAAWHRLTSSKVAIKTYDKSKLKDPAHWKRVHSEIKIMEQISHPRIARMYEAVETPKRMHLIMECLDGGNLCSYVKAKRRLSEDESRRIFFQILQAIEHLHSLGVSHRDVKLENVLFADDKDIKLIDFGFSTVCQPGKKLKVFCGTPSYMAPEIVRRSEYEGKPVDMWSMGILLYALLCGCFPFRAKAYPDLYRRIARGTFPIPDELSAPVKDLLRQLLTVDPDARITAHAAIRHSWLQVQLINAPNIDKLRQETTILISDKPADDLDDQVISELEKFGMNREEVIRLVLTKTHSSLATLYYLLLDTLVTRRKHAAKRSGGSAGVIAPHMSSSGGARERPKSAAATSSSSNAINLANGGMALGTGIKHSTQQQTPIISIQQQQLQQQQQAQQHNAQLQAEQLQQQQYLMSDDPNSAEYRYRPKSAANTRVSSNNPQRPSSAYAGRRS